ncbi:pimeloyl-ACP methyl ester carboxylesterase [Bradyrhizobium sp. GM7.3]
MSRASPMTAIKPFRIAISDDVLTDLKSRLARTRWPEAELVDDWSQGAPLAWIQEICTYWADGYDWRAREAKLNCFEQFTTEIDGLDIHFLHARSKEPSALPLIITHGWPGSIVEFQKVIAPLVDPVAHGGNPADAFHVVCPSLPGFGFSGKPKTTGWGVDRIAATWAQLMDRLGYIRYGAQGGDWGSAVTTSLGMQDAEHCAGIHITLAFNAAPKVEGEPTPEEKRALAGLQALRRPRLRLFEAAIDAAADTRLRLDGFGERAGGLDSGKILGLDRLQRSSREHLHQGRAARQRHALLGDGDRDLVGAALLGKLWQAPDHAGRQGADGRGCLSQGDHHAGAALDGAELPQHHALERDGEGRPFRRIRAAGAVCRRGQKVLPDGALRRILRQARTCPGHPRP